MLKPQDVMKVSAGIIQRTRPDQLLLCKFIALLIYFGFALKKQNLSFVAMTMIAEPREVM